MNLRLVTFALVALSIGAFAQDPARLAIGEMLNPATRMQAFQRFVLRSDTDHFKQSTWSDLKEFAEAHRELTVANFREGADNAPVYLLTWRRDDSTGWTESNRLAESPRPSESLVPLVPLLSFQVFSADGAPRFEKDAFLGTGESAIADFNGDGVPEIIEKSEIAGLELLQIRSLDSGATASFAILYNERSSERAAGNDWGFQVRIIEGFASIERNARLKTGRRPLEGSPGKAALDIA